ncbi:redoxin domain-containing protein [Neorhodopirellula pilleata]|uniref:Thiol-disulfide oxidoreductase n=1 Tax=Neorhodopirellula pilleata TaxID=2714738 RepID=A0A5C6AXQ6_9BACT|nr:redoxin domain-containing protein [Neorhodopirellula pilleata]TWU03866.1 thiol-disulfide oxidoreductase [Neorhodopirellula pilleata]
MSCPALFRFFQTCVVVAIAISSVSAADTVSESSATLPSWSLTNVHGETITDEILMESSGDPSLVVVAFLGTECPLAKLYARTLNRLHQKYESKGVRFLAVMSNRQDSLEEIAAFAKRSELQFPIGKDLANRFADAIGAERTPEVFVFDADRLLRYRGRIDDQYGIGTILDSPRRNDLQIAIDELLSGQTVSTPKTEAVGCIIGRRKESTSEQTEVTFHEHVAPILDRHCVECHREGEIGPFALQDYDEVAGWADMIVETTSDRRMPPWHAGEQSSVTFRNERRLTDTELDTLRQWAETGTARGNPSQRSESSGDITREDGLVRDDEGKVWQLPRRPDHVFKITESPVDIPASGEVKYQYYRVDPEFDRDVWVSAMQLRPGNRSVVHHILVFARPKGSNERLHAERGYLDGYVPGYRVESFAPGYAKRIPANSELIFQVHYTPTGVDEQDLSEFALVEVDPAEVTHEIHTNSSLNVRLNIPPGEANYTSTARSPSIPAGAELLAMMPHMHVRGKSFRYELQTPSPFWSKLTAGTAEDHQILLDVPRYDFNWQTAYVLTEPIPLPQGARLFCRAVFDNSEANLSNPDPTATVRWGDQTWDEMMIGYFHYALPKK